VPKPAQRRRRTSPETDYGVDVLVTILDEIRHGRAATRPEIVDRTGIGRGVVAKTVADLIERGLVDEQGTGRSTGGRAPRMLRLRAEAGHLLAADIGATSIGVAVTDLASRILRHVEEPADLADGPATILDRMHELFQGLLDDLPDVPGSLWGIGIGVPGPVEFSTGRSAAPPVPGWDGYPVRDVVAERYRVPVWVDNDVNVMALGELRAGIAGDHDTIVFVKIGTWIGGGLISGGHVHRGVEGSAGEIGHVRITDDPTVLCRCGRVGCLAALAGGSPLARDGERLARAKESELLAEVLERTGRIEAKDVAHAARLGETACRELVLENGRRIGQALAMVVNVYAPSLVVIGGGVARAGDELLAAIRESIYAFSLPLATRHLAIQRTALDELGGVIGAASMAADEIFARHRMVAWLPDGTPGGHPELAAPPA
jgi:glucokinase-like ROK family protein